MRATISIFRAIAGVCAGLLLAGCLVVAATGAAGFNNGQAAVVVIGQPDFVTNAFTQNPAANDIPIPGVPVAVNGNLYLPDARNGRVLGFNSIPVTNGANADFVLGQASFTVASTSGELGLPTAVTSFGGQLFVDDGLNGRVAVFNPIPTAANSAPRASNPEHVLWYLTAGSQGGFIGPMTAVGGGKLVVADRGHHRVLIWSSIPTGDTAANVVLGQPDFASVDPNQSATIGTPPSASTLNFPTGVWTDGARLAVVDSLNNRVLIWNTFPTQNNQPADLVLGQADFTSATSNRGIPPSASTLSVPQSGIFSDGVRLFVSDTGNNRVLIWNAFPTKNDQDADGVLGQSSFASSAPATSQAGLWGPKGLYLDGKQLIVADGNNSRYLVFKSF